MSPNFQSPFEFQFKYLAYEFLFLEEQLLRFHLWMLEQSHGAILETKAPRQQNRVETYR